MKKLTEVFPDLRGVDADTRTLIGLERLQEDLGKNKDLLDVHLNLVLPEAHAGKARWVFDPWVRDGIVGLGLALVQITTVTVYDRPPTANVFDSVKSAIEAHTSVPTPLYMDTIGPIAVFTRYVVL